MINNFSGSVAYFAFMAFLTQGALAGVYQKFSYDIVDGTGVKITGYSGGVEDLVIPDTIEGLPVTIIGNNAFESKTFLKTIQIPATVQNIQA